MTDKERLQYRMKHLIPQLSQTRLLRSIITTPSGVPQSIEFPMTWGKIAAKVWGPEDGRRVLALHGWLENSNSFDTLIPLLPKNLRIIAVDMPGHGLSDHYPPDINYQYFNCILDIERLVRRLNWPTFSILGHSLGGCMAFTYAGTFPEKVEKIVTIDAIRPGITYPETIGYRLRKTVNVLLKQEQFILSPSGPDRPSSFKSLVEKHIWNTAGSLNEEACHILFERGLKQVGDGYALRRDPRLLAAPLSYNPKEENLSMARKITSDILIIKSTWKFHEKDEDVVEHLEALQTNSKSFRFVEVDAPHHVHLTHPQLVAPLISEIFST